MSNKQRRPPKGGGPRGQLPPGPKDKQKIKIQPKKKPKNDVVNRLQELIQEKDEKIDKLKDRINTLFTENKALKKKVENLQAAGPPKKKSGGGVGTGPSQNAAKALLAKKLAGGGGGGGVETGPSQGNAAAALAAKLGGHVKNKKMAEKKAADSGGVESGPSQKGAAAALGAMFAKKKDPPKPKSSSSSSKSSGKGGYEQYKTLFKKYEMMMKLGINVHGAVGRMRQDGCDKAAIAAFEKKHGAFIGEESDQLDEKELRKLGLKPKKEVPVGRGIKMKRLHWDPIKPKSVVGSLWSSMDESQIKYDRKHFELHFQVRQRKPAEDDRKTNGSNQRKNGDEKITFVSKKRTQAVLIGLKNLNLSNDQLRKVLHNMDEKVMTVDQLSKLLEMAPSMDEQTEAEKKIMQEGTRKVSDYGTVEQFFFTLCDFYHLQQRLKLWMFKQNFREICDSLLDQYKTIGKACDKIRNNKNLKLLLTIILAFGNHMNSGTRKGCIYGFDIKVLTQMTGVKSFDNTRSLLMYIYEFCDRKYPEALLVHNELYTILKSASSMELDTLKTAYSRIKDNMQEIKNLIQSDEIENYDMDDRFIMVLTQFFKSSSPKMKKFNMTVGNVMVSTKRVMKKYSYGTEDSPQSIESFFNIFYKFMDDFKSSKEKLIKLEKDRQKRIAKRKKAKDKSKKKALHKKYNNKKGALPANPNNDDDEPALNKNSSLYKAFAKKKKFDDHKNGLHNKLRGHVKQRSIFVQKGGKIDDKNASSTMRRLSSMYQQTQDEVKSMEDARKKAAILKYNKFRLPDINKHKQRKWTTDYNQFDKKPFAIPDNGPKFSAPGGVRPPPGRGRGGGPSPTPKQHTPTSTANKYGIKPKKKKNNNKTKANGHTSPINKSIPGPPPNKLPPNNNGNFVYKGGIGGNMGGGGNNNPQQSWAQQSQALGYGSIPNLSYQQYQQQQQQQQYNNNPNQYNNGNNNGNNNGYRQPNNNYHNNYNNGYRGRGRGR